MTTDKLIERVEAADRLERLVDQLLGIETPMMKGDNLAVSLCSYFDNPDQPTDDETGWSDDAVAVCDEVQAAFHKHFAPLIAALRASTPHAADRETE